MDLSFQEKSAWGVLAGLVVVSAVYFPAAFNIVARVPSAVPLIVISVIGLVVFIIFQAVYHALIAVRSGQDTTDERDRLIELRAERISSLALGLGLFTLVGNIIFYNIFPAATVLNPLQIAVWIMLLITLAEVIKLLCQIWYYRAGI